MFLPLLRPLLLILLFLLLLFHYGIVVVWMISQYTATNVG
jgi:hypothetical protein